MPHIELEFHHNQVTLILIYSQKRVKVIFLHSWPQQSYRALRFGTHTYIASVLNCTDFCHCWTIFGPLVATNTQKGDLTRAPWRFLSFFSTCFDIWTWNLVYTLAWHIKFEFHRNQVSASGEFSGLFSKCFEVSIWKLFFTLSRLHNILSSCFTRIGVPVTYFMFLAYAKLINNALTDAGKRA